MNESSEDEVHTRQRDARLRWIEEKGMKPGTTVLYNRVAPLAKIQEVDSLGFVTLCGVQAQFAPQSLSVWH